MTENDKAGLKEAFDSSPYLVWILKGDNNNKLLDKEDANDMTALTSYRMDFVIYLGETYGHIIKSVDNNDKFQGAVILLPPVSTFLFQQAYMRKAILHNGMPPSCIWNDPSRKARYQAFGDAMTKHHREVMHDCMEDHWYILILGVAPSAQGKQVGTRLLQQAIHLANNNEGDDDDDDNHKRKPIYLDCQNQHVSYYEKFGFQCAKNYALETPKEQGASSNDDSTNTFYFNAMRRDPQ
ncbi:MAG: hypothetical protein SGBAC_007159 [Bacillariaceae sp.]